ncbi:MAG: hypothetical protein Q9186_006607 [Xanthomendoza sp. 1 TL-2023]
MQRWGLRRSDATQMVKSKRNVAKPNPAFYTQLKIWGSCDYNIRSVISINGVKPFKEQYSLVWNTKLEDGNQRLKRGKMSDSITSAMEICWDRLSVSFMGGRNVQERLVAPHDVDL